MLNDFIILGRGWFVSTCRKEVLQWIFFTCYNPKLQCAAVIYIGKVLAYKSQGFINLMFVCFFYVHHFCLLIVPTHFRMNPTHIDFGAIKPLCK